MKKWLRNSLVAGLSLLGSAGLLKGQNFDKDFVKYLSDSSNWETCEVHEGIKQPVYNSRDSLDSKTVSFKEAKNKLGINYITELDNLGFGYVTSKEQGNSHGVNYEMLSKFSGGLSEDYLKRVDKETDKIITGDEISLAAKDWSKKMFLDYASKQLGVSQNEIVSVGKGYVTSRDLENKLNALGNVYGKLFGEKLENFYGSMSLDDKVLTEEEIVKTAQFFRDALK